MLRRLDRFQEEVEALKQRSPIYSNKRMVSWRTTAVCQGKQGVSNQVVRDRIAIKYVNLKNDWIRLIECNPMFFQPGF